MELSGELFSSTFRLLAALLYAAILLLAVRLAYWRLLLDRELLHVFLGSCVILIMLWHIRAQIDPTWSFHLLGVTAVTLMFGWSFAVLAGAISEFAVSVNGLENWEGFALNAFLLTLVPATLTQMILVLVRGLLPKNFFIFVLLNAFLTAGLVAMVSGFLAVGLLLYTGAHDWEYLRENLVPFFPLMFLPEAVINGWIVTMLVLYKPRWVLSFSDELYLKGS
ncbi:MAG: energy-coupling factor ABC transporter permease [Gammaproteobacteria bacterium]|nr:energy-coupling factor ABC transporter permease [Gammaproteobacteria bacterium]MCP5405933.1 energy-coupling factor ABC transporter permease [Chromatiaceae bacterium]MCP5442489.1 energy-coupling factor ABC transporter permease [Chromatiaceae bacterium]